MSVLGASQSADDVRTAAIAANLDDARAAIAAAARDAGRDPAEITLVAVTKTWPAQDVTRLFGLGVRDFGENKAQELTQKVNDCNLPADAATPIRWHFVGQLQRNKAKLVAPHVAMVHSVDRAKLITALDTAMAAVDRESLRCLIQINLDEQRVPGRAGVLPAEAAALADQVAAADHLEIAGVMGVAPHTDSLDDTKRAFDRLWRASQQIADQHPAATVISAGMSGDFAPAIAAGATHVRLGAVLLGERRIGEVTSEPGGGFPPRPVQCKSRE